MGKSNIVGELLVIARSEATKNEMKRKLKIDENGNYFCDTGISVQDWKQIICDDEIMKDERKKVLTWFYNERNHKSTCKALAEKHSSNYRSINAIVMQFAKKNRFCFADSSS